MNELVALERTLCEAISRGDMKMLDALIADDYTHIHATGRLDDKQGFVSNIAQKPRTTSRASQSVRVYGDTAILIGEQTNEFADGRALKGLSQAVAIRQNGTWRFVAGQLTNTEKA
jgi:ketosteroid isomerase-like protein